MKLQKALPPRAVEAARQLAFQREFDLALKQRRRIFYAKFKRLQRVEVRHARKGE